MARSCKLVVMDAAPLIKLAVVQQLDLLLRLGLTVIIPDEVLFEAAEKHSWMDGSPIKPDRAYLNDWVDVHRKTGRVVWRETFIGSSSKDGRASGKLTPQNYPDNLGELCADSVFLAIADPVVLLLDYVAVKPTDVHVFTTYSFLLQLEEMNQIDSAEAIWSKILVELPNGPVPSSILVDPSRAN